MRRFREYIRHQFIYDLRAVVIGATLGIIVPETLKYLLHFKA